MNIGILAQALNLVLLVSDLSPSDEGWQGTSYVTTTAMEANVELTLPDTLNWNEVSGNSILFVVNLDGQTVSDNLLRFIHDGGKAVLTLDVGNTIGRTLAELGLRALSEELDHDSYYEDHPAFPRISRPKDSTDSFLWFNVEEVVGNHPVVLRSTGKKTSTVNPLVHYRNQDDWFAVEVGYGRGSVVVVADTSLIINDMQRHLYGDKQFLANLYRYHCDSTKPCRVSMLLPGTEYIGSWNVRVPPGLAALEYLFERGLDSIETTWTKLGSELSRPYMLSSAGWLLFGLLMWLLGRLQTGRTKLTFSWAVSSPVLGSMAKFWVAALSRNRKEASFARPVAALLADFESQVVALIPELRDADLKREQLKVFAERIANKSDEPIFEPALRCLAALNKVRQGASSERLPHFTLREFEDIWKNCRTVRNAVRPKPL